MVTMATTSLGATTVAMASLGRAGTVRTEVMDITEKREDSPQGEGEDLLTPVQRRT